MKRKQLISRLVMIIQHELIVLLAPHRPTLQVTIYHIQYNEKFVKMLL